ncbi:hypothetical protein VC83_09656 [Pseudogymnoascus destructans]|uniref:HAT C-terminal dimerisation domain-containing protein n=1 Tax=Pseudogymnoascus destructans TaxID=655981 RepID=A0A2P6FGM7_9PEZI|nr:uncharacterized protein VC83_09656 [Pseudogymnoascus destructans]PQM43529.1 hypothetical protein VC83_09656 [Pseudogymnoascus destructans]
MARYIKPPQMPSITVTANPEDSDIGNGTNSLLSRHAGCHAVVLYFSRNCIHNLGPSLATPSIDIDSEDELYVSQSHHDTEPEWKRWMKEPTVGRNTDILKYWQSKQFQYPLIASIAKDHLAIPATSADSERVFSVGGDIITKKRNRLSPSTLRYLLCLRNWGIISQGDDKDSGDDADNES